MELLFQQTKREKREKNSDENSEMYVFSHSAHFLFLPNTSNFLHTEAKPCQAGYFRIFKIPYPLITRVKG
jgi:hypothetical protein